MRIKGPADRPAQVPAVDETAATGAIEPPPAAAAKVAPESSGGAADPIAEVARRLKGGEITAGEAVELVIDEIVARQVGPTPVDRRALAGELKALLRRQAETDPYLAERVSHLGKPE